MLFIIIIYQFKSAESMINDTDLIEQALNIKLPKTDTHSCDEENAILDNSFAEVMKGNYRQALEIELVGMQKYPQNFNLQTTLATLLGDYSSHFENPIKEKMLQRSKEVFEKLLNEVQYQEKRTYYWFMNEYNYRFGKFKDQYELGLVRVKDFWNTTENRISRISSGYYSQGVGVANYAKVLLLNGYKKLALDFAQKAVVAWAQYFSYKNSYYNAYVHYSMALAILGFKEEALRALEHASEIINKDHIEFQEVKDFIESAEQSGLL